MASNVELLDCTLRDGGYVNDWDFGHSVITGTYRRLDAAGVDFIEVGFLDDRRSFDPDRSIYPDTAAIDKIFAGVEKRGAMAVAMIDFGTCAIDRIAPAAQSFIDGIRVIFKKEKIAQALPFCRQIKEKGYKLFVQAISITAYSDDEILKYVEQINEIKPYAFSIVDTYGLLDNEGLDRYFALIDGTLDPLVKLGYHAHNNFQLAFSNTVHILSHPTRRRLIVDSTVYGMGKSAGNCATELIVTHLNERFGKKYDIDLILEIIDTDLMQIYQRHYWGYRYGFFISAMQKCHPNYVDYLLAKKTLSVSSINDLLRAIPEEKKLLYDKMWIEKAYLEYQRKDIDDAKDCARLAVRVRDARRVVVLGPGRSLGLERESVLSALVDSGACVFSVNFSDDCFPVDYVFISNRKRYSKLVDVLRGRKVTGELLITSNIAALDCYSADAVFNFESLIDDRLTNRDNGLMLLLRLLVRIGVRSVELAGFDGFGGQAGDYCDRSYDFATEAMGRNESISEDLSVLSKEITIKFITQTRYAIG